MSTYIALGSWTEQGVKNIKDFAFTSRRSTGAREEAWMRNERFLYDDWQDRHGGHH